MKMWFSIGVVCSFVIMFLSSVLLICILVNTLLKQASKEQQPILTPIMPGVNLPNNQLGYFFVSLLFCALFHELAHALAAVCEEVRVNGSGIFVLFLYPGAFVDLDSQQVEALTPFRQLRIYCAGVWHNVVIVILSLLLLLFLPSLLHPLYHHGNQVTVTSVLKNSVISGVDGVEGGDSIGWVDECQVRSSSDWLSCIQSAWRQPSRGFCVQQKASSANSSRERLMECCSDASSSQLCFYHQLHDNTFEHHCLVVRHLLDHPSCLSDLDCATPPDPPLPHKLHLTTSKPSLKPEVSRHHSHEPSFNRHYANSTFFHRNEVFLKGRRHFSKDASMFAESPPASDTEAVKWSCLKPSIGNFSRLVVVSFIQQQQLQRQPLKKPLLFLGHPYDLYHSVTLSNYSPKYSFLPLNPPSVIETLLRYFISLSGALAVLNIVPCYSLDGQWICKALFNCFLPRWVPNSHSRNIIYSATISIGTFLVASNVFIALWTLFVN